MKRRDLIKLLEKNGWTFKRAAVERHREIPEALAQAIIRRRGLK